ncbi:hypothetical protein KAR91_40605, partial [Candidatus Pacearchaeota archaeon]|nr:hypothetical protein [Candidatus Pacearchaeota archaeon]
MKTFTIEQLRGLDPCSGGYKWYGNNIKTENIREIFLQLNDHRPDWARWLFKRLINKEQSVKIAVFAAELVLHIFEDKYPKDKRPRKAIEAAKAHIKDPSKKNAAAADADAAAADAAAAAADADAAAAAADADAADA